MSYIMKTIGLGAAAVALLILLHVTFGLFPRMDIAIERIKRFTQNEESVDKEKMDKRALQRLADETLQADMAQIAVKEGSLLGKGPGKSTQRYVLPHPYSDYIYSIIIEEYGIWGGMLVLMLYVWFFYRCVLIVKECRTVFAAITVGGLGAVIMVQAMLHILVNVGIFPVTGHTLPLISLGGTSFIIISGAFGIILSISRTKEDAQAEIEERERLEKEQKRLERQRQQEMQDREAKHEQAKQDAMSQEERDAYLRQRYADQLGSDE
jgi:cell division protein FtsW